MSPITGLLPGRLRRDRSDRGYAAIVTTPPDEPVGYTEIRALPLEEEREAMRPLPQEPPDVDRRLVTRVPPDPYVRVDSNDYSLDPTLVGRRVDVRVSQREVTAICLDTGELACRHQRSFAKHRTITALEHARVLRAQRTAKPIEPEVELRPLARYDALIPA